MAQIINNKIVRRDQTAWNIADKHSSLVGEFVSKAWRDFRAGFLEEWFWDLNTIREIVGHDLTEKECEDLDKLEDQLYGMLIAGHAKKRTEFRIAATQYARKIMKILKFQGYFPSKEDRTKLSF